MSEFLNISPSLLAAAEAGAGHEPGFWGVAFYIVLVVALLIAAMAWAKKGLKDRVFKNPVTQLFEQLYLFIEQMAVGTIGGHGRKYIPILMTLWMVIFLGNIIALFFPFAPTADLSFNLAMALISVGYVQWEGIKANGLIGHITHFAGPKLGLALIPITGMIFLIELVSEVMKNLSLSLRLYGNIHGGHEAVTAMNTLGEGYYIPIGAFLLPIKLLTCVVQAMIFTLLTTVYLSLVTSHDHDEAHSAAPAH